MYEEVCLVCGRPVLADGRAYCGDECESQDITSPSISTTSSAQPSPFLRSSHNTSAQLLDVPALHPFALGQSIAAHAHKGPSHRVRHSESSSSTSSASWCALDDDDNDHEEDSPSLAIYNANTTTDDEYVHPDYTVDPNKLSPSVSVQLQHPSSLAYVRRPSATNHRAIIPALHRRTSSVSALTTSTGVSRSIHDLSADEDSLDASISVPYSAPAPPTPSSASVSVRSDRRRHGRKSADLPPPSAFATSDEDGDTTAGKKRRNRASLPAYFSLLVSTATNPSSRSHHKGSASSASALSMLSRSLQNNNAVGSPPTPRVANPVLDTTSAFAMAQSQARAARPTAKVSASASASAAVSASISASVSASISMRRDTESSAPRGRSRRRDPDGRSSSSRRSPSRSPGPRTRVRAHHRPQEHERERGSAVGRARLDSLEKVADWVAHSPVVAAGVRAAKQLAAQQHQQKHQQYEKYEEKHHHHRRNSSPLPLPKFEKLAMGVREGMEFEDGEVSGMWEERHGFDGERRGRMRVDELPAGMVRDAPGYGIGRSGLVSRERERERGRSAGVKR